MHLSEPAGRVPVAGIYDVVVCGGGPAGVSAAISAAQSGAKTMLIEGAGTLGGVWTAGQLCVILDAVGKGGLMEEIESRLISLRAYLAGSSRRKFTYDVEAMKYILDTLCREAGVDVRLYTRVAGALREADRITAVFTEGYSGREAVLGNMFVDATGNGQLSMQAGCGFEIGHPDTGQCQPASMIGIIAGVPADEQGTRSEAAKIDFRKVLESAGFEPSYRKPSLWRLPNHELCCLSVHHAYGVSCDDTQAITDATIEGRKQLNEAVLALQTVPGWENVRLVSTSAHLGIREGRRIHGEYRLTVDDLREGTRFDDAICTVRFGVDIHAITREDDDLDGSYNQGIKTKPYHVPLRSLIARDVRNLALAGRCVSGDFFAHSSYRVTGNSVPMGEAAGIAAAMASKDGIALRELDGVRVHQAMKDRGYEV